MMKHSNVAHPQCANAECSKINCYVQFDGFESALPFTADSSDIEEHCRLIYQELVSGKWGEISPFVNTTE